MIIVQFSVDVKGRLRYETA